MYPVPPWYLRASCWRGTRGVFWKYRNTPEGAFTLGWLLAGESAMGLGQSDRLLAEGVDAVREEKVLYPGTTWVHKRTSFLDPRSEVLTVLWMLVRRKAKKLSSAQ